ncbi:hypothetical protein ROLI_032720 [Roseobacter fucihabitans]|uniref:Secreted protein n=1 Tax=Roseobacter fucihabitans TaxID=1537242 RepID=A0ABZ2BVV3_9RHOB|nr:hypothetical protein [Roseobacter litoralis]MBC6964604.1 hypothetical protein [Roseobacter litoralis]
MRGFLTLAVAIVLAATVAFGASSISMRGLPGIAFLNDRIDVQAEVLNASFGIADADLDRVILQSPKPVVPFSDAAVRFGDLSQPKGNFGYTPVDPTSGADPIDDFRAVALRRCIKFMNGTTDLIVGPPTFEPSFLGGNPVDPVTFGFQPAVFRSGGGGGANVPVATTTPPLFIPPAPPTDGPVITTETQIAPIPVPAALLLFGTAFAGLALMHRRKPVA